MKNHIILGPCVHFRQSVLPAQWMTTFASLGVYVELTGSKRYPYAVRLSESEFLSCVEMAETL